MISPESTGESLPYGLTVLADGIDPVLDIVAVHGLNGHREKTWVVNSVHWLRDFLPLDIPNARIYSWGYDANVHSTSPINAQCLYDHSTTLISDLNRERKRTKTSTRPTIFVAHSLEGVVVKNALILSENTREGSLEEHRSIKLSTYGILFMGTPPQGNSGAHLGELMLNVASIFVAFNDRVLRHLEQDSEWLEQQLGQFAPISRDFAIKFACEIHPTPIASGETRMIVPRHLTAGTADADIILIPADHLNMVKFASREDGGYKKVSEYLWLLAKEAPDAISARWAEQKKTKKVQANVKQDFSVPFSLFGVPKVKKFVGRKKELIMIKEAFEGDGTQRKIVILHGLGGVGKTQLAVEFLKAHRDIYSAIFWLNGRNEDTLKQSFAGMASRLYMQYPSSTLLKTATESQDANETIAVIKQWLSKKDNNKWFLVFDNVDNPKLPGTSDSQAYDIRSYFPEAHHGLILITTRSSRLNIGKVISVKKLADIQENIIILATTSGRKDLDQDPYAINLIEELDGLPLELATTGAYLSQVEISLKDYLYHYKTSWLRLQQTTPGLLFYEDTLYTTWNLSLQHIQKQNKSAEKLLRLWAYFDNQDLWFHLLAAGRENGPEWFTTITKDELSFTKIVELLCDHALIKVIFDLEVKDNNATPTSD